MTPSTAFRTDINALRALAVGIVVMFHFRFPGFGGGFLGVDIFFVISGYLMTRIVVDDLARARFGYLAFVGMRVARIWPALVALLLVLLALGALLLPPTDYQDLAEQLKAAALFNSNNHFAQGLGYFSNDTEERWLLHTWSLSVEWQFYMLYPLLLMVLHRMVRPRTGAVGAASEDGGTRQRHSVLLAALVVLSLASFAFNLWATRHSQATAFFSLPARMWEMLGGGIVYLGQSRLAGLSATTRGRLQAFAFVALFATMLAAGKGNWEHQWPGGWAAFPVLLTMLALAAGPTHSGLSRHVIDNPAVQRLGLYSYSIYLWHWPIVVALYYIEFNPEWTRHMLALKIAGVLASVLLGHLSYTWVEQRFKYRRDRTWYQATTVKTFAGLAAAIACAISVVVSDGWIQRTNEEQGVYRSLANIKTRPIISKPCQNSGIRGEKLVLCSIRAQNSGPKILVYGDSHAQHLYAWFEANTTLPIDFLTSSGCPPIPNHNRKLQGYYCNEFVALALQKANSEEYKIIVVAGNWSGVPTLCQVEDGKCSEGNFSAKENFDLAVQKNIDAWKNLTSKGKHVFIIEQSPISSSNVFTQSVRRKFFRLDEEKYFTDTQKAGNPGIEYTNEVFRRTENLKNIRRISLRSDICEAEKCLALDQKTNLPIFMDKSHFAPDWIEKNGKSLLPVISLDLK